MRRLGLTATLVTIALVVGAATAHAARSIRPWSIPPENVEVIACHVSWNSWSRKPSLARSTQNPCAGVARVFVNGKGRIVVDHDFGPVIAIEITPNETTVGRGVSAGGSGGGTTTEMTVHDARIGRALHLTRTADARRLGSGTGFWIRLTHDGR